jgi:hypothetical protein
VRQFDGVPVGSGALTSSAGTFGSVLRRILSFSRAAEVKGDSPDRPRTKVAPIETSHDALDGLKLFVRSLDDETRDKLQALMRAGREAQSLPEVHGASAGATRPAGDELHDLFSDGRASLDHLQCGHAVACATGLDLESKRARWSALGANGSLDSRVWSRFGRELARSSPNEWSCLAVLNREHRLEKLYLRRGDRVWWSFDSLVDRPSERQLARERALYETRRRKIVWLPLEDVLGRETGQDRTAVRRAARAMSARLGFARTPLEGPEGA